MKTNSDSDGKSIGLLTKVPGMNPLDFASTCLNGYKFFPWMVGTGKKNYSLCQSQRQFTPQVDYATRLQMPFRSKLGSQMNFTSYHVFMSILQTKKEQDGLDIYVTLSKPQKKIEKPKKIESNLLLAWYYNAPTVLRVWYCVIRYCTVLEENQYYHRSQYFNPRVYKFISLAWSIWDHSLK